MRITYISDWNELQRFGINVLTGESCAYSMRLLCDVSQDGADLLCDFFGLPIDTAFQKNWNSTVGDKPAIGSIMLSRGVFDDLCRFILFSKAGAEEAIRTPAGSWTGYSDINDNMARSIAQVSGQEGWGRYRNFNCKAASSRNAHAFTGRTA